MREELDTSYYITDYGTKISANDVDKFQGGHLRLNVELKDYHDMPLVGEKVGISINGVTYYREISSEGYASIAINLESGIYQARVFYDAFEDSAASHPLSQRQGRSLQQQMPAGI